MIKLKKPIIFFDLETTGVDILQDRIVQIGVVKMFPNSEKEVKNYLVNPNMSIPTEASEIHGIYDKDVKNKPDFSKYAKNLNKYFEGCDIGGYNSNRFDIPLLIEEFKRSGIDFKVKDRNYIDVLKLEVLLNPRTLSAVYERYMGKELEEAHDASIDVEATIDIFGKQIEHRDLPETISEIDIFSQDGKERVDIAGKLSKIENEICWTFGKWKDKPIRNELGYVSWYLKQDVPSETRKIIQEICYGK